MLIMSAVVNRPHTRGFTLVEMIVSLALFSVVVTISVGGLLVLISANKQLQEEQNVLTNLSFAIDSIAREIRTGIRYDCTIQNSYASNNPFGSVAPGGTSLSSDLDSNVGSLQDCYQGNTSGARLVGISFIEGGDSITNTNERILYWYDSTEQALYRRVGTRAPEPIADFFVTGSQPLGTGTNEDRLQPTVTIVIEAAAADEPSVTYLMQTTITQRALDL